MDEQTKRPDQAHLYLDLLSTPITWVDTEFKLKEMQKKLKQQKEFAIDLEVCRI